MNVTRTRSVWNELPYGVLGVDDDGRIAFPPANQGPPPSFRANPADLSALDLTIEQGQLCSPLNAFVRNAGRVSLAPGRARVRFYVNTNAIGEVPIDVALDPGASVEVRLQTGSPPAGSSP